MNIKELNNNCIIITPTDGYLLAVRGDPNVKLFSRVFTLASKISDYYEIQNNDYKKENFVPQYNVQDSQTLDELKQMAIKKTQDLLQIYLKNHPLLFSNGLYYSVSSESQAHLLSVIQACDMAAQLNIPFTPYWNSTSNVRLAYNVETLKNLFIDIQDYIVPFVQQQQQMELEILSLTTKEDVLNYNIVYNNREEN